MDKRFAAVREAWKAYFLFWSDLERPYFESEKEDADYVDINKRRRQTGAFLTGGHPVYYRDLTAA